MIIEYYKANLFEGQVGKNKSNNNDLFLYLVLFMYHASSELWMHEGVSVRL